LIELSLALKEGVAQTVNEMLSAQESAPREVVGFPAVKVSFMKPDGGVFKVLKREDLPTVGLKEDQEIYVYKEA